jgi:hypothetical protein
MLLQSERESEREKKRGVPIFILEKKRRSE